MVLQHFNTCTTKKQNRGKEKEEEEEEEEETRVSTPKQIDTQSHATIVGHRCIQLNIPLAGGAGRELYKWEPLK